MALVPRPYNDGDLYLLDDFVRDTHLAGLSGHSMRLRESTQRKAEDSMELFYKPLLRARGIAKSGAAFTRPLSDAEYELN